MNTGTLGGLYGSWGSGLAYLMIDDDALGAEMIACDNGPTVRTLASMIGPGHTINNDAIAGTRIAYGATDYGLLEWIALETVALDETDDYENEEA